MNHCSPGNILRGNSVRSGNEADITSKTGPRTRVRLPREVSDGSADARFNYSRNFEMQGAVSVKRMHGHNAPRNDKLNRFPLGVVSSVTTTLLF